MRRGSCLLLRRCEEISIGPCCRADMKDLTYMTKSSPPSSLTHLSTAFCRLSTLLTSIAPIPRTLAPDLAVAISCAIFSTFSTLRPTMHAFAPRWTSARTWALQMEPEPPVQKTTLSSIHNDLASALLRWTRDLLLKIPSFHTSLR